MPFLSAWAVRRPAAALVAWFVALVAVVTLGVTVGGSLNDRFDLPDTESKTAMDLLTSSGTDTSRLDGGATIVWSPATGSAVDAASANVVSPLLDRVAALASVTCVSSPFDPAVPAVGRDCPEPTFGPQALQALTPQEQQTLAAAFSSVSPDGRVAYATVSFAVDGDGAAQLSTGDAKAIIDAVTTANSPDVTVGAQGQLLDFAGQEPPSSEAVGLVFAVMILLVAFGSLVAVGLPIVPALLGLAMGQTGVLLVANVMDVATFAPTLAAMIGLGVGIDYGLFVVNRYRQGLLHGHDPRRSAVEAVDTAGRAVLFAGSTVIIALLGLFVLRISFFNGLALAAAVTVLCVMLSALWFLPALLSLLGARALAVRLPWGKPPGALVGHPEGGRWAQYGRLLQRRPLVPALLSLILVVLLALPMFGLRQGFADDSGKPVGSPARIAYDLRANGFGPGVNGPFLVVADLSSARTPTAYADVVAALAATDGVAGTSPSVDVLPVLGKLQQAAAQSAAQDGASAGSTRPAAPVVQAIAVFPSSAPQDEATTQLLDRLRSTVAPQLAAATGVQVFVGGQQAVTSDFTTVLGNALPLFLAVVIGLGFLALVLLFRSLVVPLTAAVTSLLSFGAAMGVTVAVFQWGWFASVLGVPGTGPIMPFLPIMVFAILFGLSMDYQVFLVSRMQEEWVKTGDNRAAVRRGLAGSGRVVVIAAAIMSSVFLAFVPSTNGTIKLFGIALASAVLVDAFVVRLLLVPALMSLLGRANWWLPGWLDRLLPQVHIEPPDAAGEEELTDDVPTGVR